MIEELQECDPFVKFGVVYAENLSQHLEQLGLPEISDEEQIFIINNSYPTLSRLFHIDKLHEECPSTFANAIFLNDHTPENRVMASHIRFMSLMDYIFYEVMARRTSDPKREIFTDRYINRFELKKPVSLEEDVLAFLKQFLSSIARLEYQYGEPQNNLNRFIDFYLDYVQPLDRDELVALSHSIFDEYIDHLQNPANDIESFFDELWRQHIDKKLSFNSYPKEHPYLHQVEEIKGADYIGLHDMEYDDRITQFLRQ